MKKYKYKAFISYSHKDRDFAVWLHKAIENYTIPKSLKRKYPDLPKDLKRSIFIDEEELSFATSLPEILKKSLDESQTLIVLCSFSTFKSKWVKQEIAYFKQKRKRIDIFPIIIDDRVKDITPFLNSSVEPLTIDASKNKKIALIKTISAIVNIPFSELFQRDKKEQKRVILFRFSIVILFIGLFLYSTFLSNLLHSNSDLNRIDKNIMLLESRQKNSNLTEEQRYQISKNLNKLKNKKRLKEDTLKWFGILNTSIAKKAKEIYNQKGVAQALKILEAPSSIVEDKQYAQKNILRAKLYIEQHHFKKAYEFYEKAIFIDASYLNLYDYALFLMKQNQKSKAITLLERLKTHKLSNDKRANVLNRLGILYRQSQKINKAKQAYTQALILRQDLVKKDPKRYQNDLAWTYNNLGVMYKENNQTKASEEKHFKALAIRKKLAKQNPKKYIFYLSCSLHNLAELYRDKHQTKKSEIFFLKALAIRKKLVQKNPKKFIPMLAYSFHDLAELYQQDKQLEKAKSFYLKALILRRRLFKNNKEAYAFMLLDTLQNIITLYKKLNLPIDRLFYELNRVQRSIHAT